MNSRTMSSTHFYPRYVRGQAARTLEPPLHARRSAFSLHTVSPPCNGLLDSSRRSRRVVGKNRRCRDAIATSRDTDATDKMQDGHYHLAHIRTVAHDVFGAACAYGDPVGRYRYSLSLEMRPARKARLEPTLEFQSSDDVLRRFEPVLVEIGRRIHQRCSCVDGRSGVSGARYSPS